MLKFGFFEKATKFEKNLRRIFDKSIVRVLCAQQRTCQKIDEDFSKQMWSSRIIQTLTLIGKGFSKVSEKQDGNGVTNTHV